MTNQIEGNEVLNNLEKYFGKKYKDIIKIYSKEKNKLIGLKKKLIRKKNVDLTKEKKVDLTRKKNIDRNELIARQLENIFALESKKKFPFLNFRILKKFVKRQKTNLSSKKFAQLQKFVNVEKTNLINERIKLMKKRGVNIKNPQTYNEKLNWIIAFDNIPKKTELTDKLILCYYVKKKNREKFMRSKNKDI